MGLSGAEIERRNAEVIRLRLEHPAATWNAIASMLAEEKKTWRITGRTCREVHAEWRRAQAAELAGDDALAMVQEHLAALRLVRQRLARVARDADARAVTVADETTGKETQITYAPNHAAVVGAYKGMADILHREMGLLQEAGLVPRNLGRIELQLDFVKTTEVFIAILHKYVPAEHRDDAELELLRDLGAQLPPEAHGTLLPALDG